MNTAQLMASLAAKYKAPEWAFLPQVADATGAGKVRTCDALAMGLWPSRGIDLHGFEVKASRSDWQRELSNPAKAESVCQYCDFWWIVAGTEKIVFRDELPPTWGLIVAKGSLLTTEVKAPRLSASPMTRPFLAAIMRRTSEYVAPKFVAPDIQSEKSAAYAKGMDDCRKRMEDQVSQAVRETDRLKKIIQDFQDASGLDIGNYIPGSP